MMMMMVMIMLMIMIMIMNRFFGAWVETTPEYNGNYIIILYEYVWLYAHISRLVVLMVYEGMYIVTTLDSSERR